MLPRSNPRDRKGADKDSSEDDGGDSSDTTSSYSSTSTESREAVDDIGKSTRKKKGKEAKEESDGDESLASATSSVERSIVPSLLAVVDAGGTQEMVPFQVCGALTAVAPKNNE